MFALAAALSLAAWLYLVFAHGRFWLADQRLDGRAPAPARWPDVVAVVPARDEAELVPLTVAALLGQDYAGRLRIVLVDDESTDGTADAAREAAKVHPNGARLEVIRAAERPDGWVGKVWALECGTRAAASSAPPDWWWLTDADVLHAPDSLARLVAKGEADQLALVSLMVELDAASGWNRLLVPAFVYFFQQLYPFPRVNDPRSRVAAAAGGCVLVRAGALARAGGIESLRGEVIDDCALGRAVKRSGQRIWLGLADRERSIRPYAGLDDVWNMVARSAYTQLHHSPMVLAGTLAGLVLLYLMPPLSVLAWLLGSDSSAVGFGLAAWLLQAASFAPTLAQYERPPWLALALPAAGALYAAMTFDSARRHWQNVGATWKGRAGAGGSAYGRTSSTRLNGVSVARRKRVKPAVRQHLAQPRLAGLRAERRADLLRERRLRADQRRHRVEEPADRVQVLLDVVAGERLDQQPGAVRAERLAHVRARRRPGRPCRAGSRRTRPGRTCPGSSSRSRPRS